MIRRRGEEGNILLTVILIVAVMAAIAVAVMDDIRFAIRRSGNVEARGQAYAYAMGAEQFAMEMISKSARLSPEKMLAQSWMREPVVFPIEGGAIEARISDAANCFNLNAVVMGNSESWAANEIGLGYYRNLLVALDFSSGDAERLANVLADWIDTDRNALPRGAEDYHYTGEDPPYRTAGTLLAEVSELRALSGYTQEVVQRLEPHVCVHPTADMSKLNVNTLDVEDAPLVVMLLGIAKLSLGDAQSAIAARPASGYDDTNEFWAERAFAGKEIGEADKALVSLKTERYDLMVRVAYLEAQVTQISLLEMRNKGMAVLSRRYGVAE